MNREVNKIYETDEYELFTFIKGNRDVVPTNVRNIKKSMKEYGYIGAPIMVNKMPDGTLGIADGQNRYVAAKDLGVPIQYAVTELTNKEIIEINKNQKNWGLKDYIHHYAVAYGDEDYQWLQSMFDKHKKLPINIINMVTCRLNTYSGGSPESIKNGSFKAREKKRSEWELDYLERYVDLVHRLKGKQTYCYTALLYAYRHPDCDHEELYNKLMSNIYALEPCGNVPLYLRMFSEIYNKNKRSGRIFLNMEWAKDTGSEF